LETLSSGEGTARDGSCDTSRSGGAMENVDTWRSSMRRFIVFAAFSALVFVVGVFAGQQISEGTSKERSVQSASMLDECSFPRDSSSSARELLTDTTSSPDETSGATAASQHSGTIVTTASLTSDATAIDGGSSSIFEISHDASNAVTPPAGATPEQLLALIHQMIPNADAETAAIWAQSYTGMDIADVQFILEQKQRLATSSSSAGTQTEIPLQTTPNPLRSAVEQNLKAAMAIGYRRLIALPEDINASGDQQGQPVVTFRSFDRGQVVSSPIASHVSVGGDSRQMFLLENQQVTRRGDFRRLADGTIGLMIAGKEYKLQNSPTQVAADATIDVSEAGEIFAVTNDGTRSSIGRLSLAAIDDLSNLTTDDGVIFRHASELKQVPESEIHVRPHSLELSNVILDDVLQLKAVLRDRF
jgi:hypothetical protein